MTQGAGRVADATGNWVDGIAPSWTRPYLRLARLDRPIGSWLLLIPCWWSVGLAAVHAGTQVNVWHLILFFLGAFAMRGAGCTWNDIVDRDLDAQVERTRSRPIPSGQVTIPAAGMFLVLQALVGLAVLLQFNSFTRYVGIASLAVVVIYPFMKRITYWPQIVLGLAFSWGALMGWPATFARLGLPAFLLYAGSIAWVIGYDTIYAHQDRDDDALIGIRSTALLFGPHTKLLLLLFYGCAVILLALAALECRRPCHCCGWACLVRGASRLADRPTRDRRPGRLSGGIQVEPRCRPDPVCRACARGALQFRAMISRSPAWTLAIRDNDPRPRRNGMDARRPLRELRRRRRAMGAAVQTPPRRANGSRRHPSDCATRSGTPSARPQARQSATTSLLSHAGQRVSDNAGSWCSSTMAIAAADADVAGSIRIATPR